MEASPSKERHYTKYWKEVVSNHNQEKVIIS